MLPPFYLSGTCLQVLVSHPSPAEFRWWAGCEDEPEGHVFSVFHCMRRNKSKINEAEIETEPSILLQMSEV